jgi:hypothetical protein
VSMEKPAKAGIDKAWHAHGESLGPPGGLVGISGGRGDSLGPPSGFLGSRGKTGAIAEHDPGGLVASRLSSYGSP